MKWKRANLAGMSRRASKRMHAYTFSADPGASIALRMESRLEAAKATEP